MIDVNFNDNNAKNLIKQVRKSLVEISSKSQPYDIGSNYNEYLAHLLYVSIEDIAETPFIRYNKHNYIVLFNDEPLMPFCVICVNDDVLFGTDEEIKKVFSLPDVLMRDGNCIRMINPDNTFTGFYILPNGAIALEYMFLEDGVTKTENILQLMPEDEEDEDFYNDGEEE